MLQHQKITMCGIAGYIHFDRERPASEAKLKKMTDVIVHRGPDGDGQFVEKNIALGHRRLAIIDLKTGQQPMRSADKTAVITYNGEIYNYLELRNELEKLGYRFSTQSDTEVLLAAYREWGKECVQRFNGMWAFAIWDEREQKLFCSRDRTGEKPFFYAKFDNTFVFGSEIKVLFAYGVPRETNWEVLDAYLCFTYIPAPNTFFKNIFKLKPGHSLFVKAGRVTTEQFWDVRIPPTAEMRKDEVQICEEFEALFYDAARLRMRSDVPFGAFLSGGLDSASVVATMSEISKTPVQTCTIGTEDKASDERDLAKSVARKFGTDHSERLVVLEDTHALLQKLAWHYDEPFGDSSALPTYLVSKIARERITMVLTGDGGDEVLSGYTIHQGEKFSQQFASVPGVLRKQFLPASLGFLKNISQGTLQHKLLRAEGVVNSANMDFVDRLEAKQNGFTRTERLKMLAHISNVRPARDFIEEAIAPVTDRDNFSKLNYWLMKVSLPDDMLCKVDRASMAHGLEARVPFLDYRIVELMATVSMDVKMKGYTRKHILRHTLGRKLPTELLKVPKRGFTIPVRQWFTNGADTILEDRVVKSIEAGFVEHQTVEAILNQHRNGLRDAGNALWTLGMLSFANGEK